MRRNLTNGDRRMRVRDLRIWGVVLVASFAVASAAGQFVVPSMPGGIGGIGRVALPANELFSVPHAPIVGGVPSGLDLGVDTTPGAVCVSPTTSCSAETDTARVTVSATASPHGPADWPAVQVLFVLETTAYDGTFDYASTGETQQNPSIYLAVCSPAYPYQLCDEANAVGAFVSNASGIADSIQAAHPATAVTFGLVDYFATHDQWGNPNGSEYHVDLGNFVPAGQFESAVDRTFLTQVLNGVPVMKDSGLGENFLHSSSITALYGALSGAGLAWSNDTHHVIVWIGSTVPRDPNYVVNYCVSQSANANHYATNVTKPGCYSSGCEPSYNFTPTLRSPACEGWVLPQDGNPNDSIAALARSSPDCRESLGGSCTIDMIEVPGGADWAGGYDPNNGPYFWLPNGTMPGSTSDGIWGCLNWGSGTCSKDGIIATQQIWQNVNRTRDASCDLAMATGGSWDGPRTSGFWPASLPGSPKPNFWTAPEVCSGTVGDLQPPPTAGPDLWSGPCVYSGSPVCDRGTEYFNESNPALISALFRVSFGAPPYSLAARGAAQRPMFTFVPFGNVQLDPYLGATVTCQSALPLPGGCDASVRLLSLGATTALAFNWSSDPNLNVMQAGDVWEASFNVMGVGPPYGVPVPADACIAPGCSAAGSQPVLGVYSWADYTLATNGSSVIASFPLAQLIVENTPAPSSPPSTQPPPQPPGGQSPPIPAPIPSPLPVNQPIPVPSVAGVAGLISVPAVAAGILASGMTRIIIRGRTVAMRVAVKAGPIGRRSRRRGKRSDGEDSRSLFE